MAPSPGSRSVNFFAGDVSRSGATGMTYQTGSTGQTLGNVIAKHGT